MPLWETFGARGFTDQRRRSVRAMGAAVKLVFTILARFFTDVGSRLAIEMGLSLRLTPFPFAPAEMRPGCTITY